MAIRNEWLLNLAMNIFFKNMEDRILLCLFEFSFQGARRLKLRNIPECAAMSGGQAIEHLAARGDPHAFEFPTPMWKYRDCTFSFSGLKNTLLKLIEGQEKKYGK